MKALFYLLSLLTAKSYAQSYMSGFESTGAAGNFYINIGYDTINRSSSQTSHNLSWISADINSNQPMPAAKEGTNFVIADYTSVYNSGTISAWLITPTRVYSNGDKFSFYTRTVGNGMNADRLEIRLSKNGTSKNVGSTATSVGDYTTTMGVINNSLASYGYPSTWTRYSYTLNGFHQEQLMAGLPLGTM